jgi:hypothetical protein
MCSVALIVPSAMRAFIQLPYASNWNEFVKVVEGITAPSLNIIFASTTGDIGYYVSGRAPHRQVCNSPSLQIFLLNTQIFEIKLKLCFRNLTKEWPLYLDGPVNMIGMVGFHLKVCLCCVYIDAKYEQRCLMY